MGWPASREAPLASEAAPLSLVRAIPPGEALDDPLEALFRCFASLQRRIHTDEAGAEGQVLI